ncbi:MAG: hypothetical protein ACRDTM_10700 [Micromonosporaceae bacterium]
MIELRLIGDPAEIDAALTVLARLVKVHQGRRKPVRGAAGQVIQYGAVVLPSAGWVTR